MQETTHLRVNEWMYIHKTFVNKHHIHTKNNNTTELNNLLK